MTIATSRRALLGGVCAILLGALGARARAGDAPLDISGKLLLTAGVSNIEGAAGGGLTPWALIGGYDTGDQIGASAFYTYLDTQDYALNDAGVLVGLYNRVEFSFAQQRFDTEAVGAALGLGQGFTFRQNVFGVKVRLLGNAILDQNSWLPQIAIGAQYKRNDQTAVLHAIGARSAHGVDYYISATKLYLAQSLLLNATLRLTRANQTGILGFGGPLGNSYRLEPEFSAAYLLTRKLAVGAEWRRKPNNLAIARESNWYDAFLAYTYDKHLSLTLAYAELGNIVIKNNQHGPYLSVQIGF